MEDRVSIDLVFFSQEEKKADGHPHSSGEGKRNGERVCGYSFPFSSLFSS